MPHAQSRAAYLLSLGIGRVPVSDAVKAADARAYGHAPRLSSQGSRAVAFAMADALLKGYTANDVHVVSVDGRTIARLSPHVKLARKRAGAPVKSASAPNASVGKREAARLARMEQSYRAAFAKRERERQLAKAGLLGFGG